MENGTEIVEGTIRSVVFHNEQNGYTVLTVEIPSDFELAKNPEITVVGRTQVAWEGEDVKAEGRWVVDKTHGRQFKADKLTCIAPRSLKGIERYLSSGLIKGVGPVLAKRIVEKFGEETMTVLSRQSERLREVPKLGKAKIAQIRSSWHANESMRENMIFGQTYGISVAKMTKIIRKYGPDAIAVIKADPYRLCRDIWGIGFATADKIALSVGIPHDSPLRARASISHTLETEADAAGHCWSLENGLLMRANELTGIPLENLAQALKQEISAGRIIAEKGDGGEPDRIYLKRYFFAEREIAGHIARIASAPRRFEDFDTGKAVSWWCSRVGFEPAERQLEALGRSLNSRFSVITGGPGVGKTTIIKALADVFAAKRLKVVLSAPTGRAAKRMSESVGMPASTIHRLLKWNPVSNRFTFSEDNPLEGDVFVFDETSMIDVSLAKDLLSAIPSGAVVVWVGDTDQLPPVGAGSVLKDMISSGVVPSTKLEFIFRQDVSGLIVKNAHHINAGEPLELAVGETDFYFVRCDDPVQCLERAVDLMSRRIPGKFRFDPMQDVQVLSPMRKNILGTENLNLRLQAALNPDGESVSRGGFDFRVKDRVMQLRNNYDKDVYNGDVGFVRAVDSDSRSIVVEFDGRPVRYESCDLDELVLSYATTIHKSQGSEYPVVIVLLHKQHYMMLQRNLLYTAITRGRKLVVLLGSPYAVDRAVAMNSVQERRTSLSERLRSAFMRKGGES